MKEVGFKTLGALGHLALTWWESQDSKWLHQSWVTLPS